MKQEIKVPASFPHWLAATVMRLPRSTYPNRPQFRLMTLLGASANTLIEMSVNTHESRSARFWSKRYSSVADGHPQATPGNWPTVDNLRNLFLTPTTEMRSFCEQLREVLWFTTQRSLESRTERRSKKEWSSSKRFFRLFA